MFEAFRCLKCYLLLFVSGCYPFYQKDPFILEECPHVYFSGNAPTFQSKIVTGASTLLPATLPLNGPLPVCSGSLNFN